jgi:arylsulfatase A-like enzyme
MPEVLRRQFLKFSGLAGIAALSAAPGTFGAEKNSPPNILFILVDDQSPFSIKPYGNTVCDTPNLDRLAAEGMTLDGAYHMGSWSGAVCTPSRTMMMTGRSVWRIPGRGNPNNNNPDQVPPNMPRYTLPAVFNRAGYDTFRTCKNGNSYPPANAQFKTVRDKTSRMGNDEDGSAWHAEQALEYLEGRESTKAKSPFFMFFGFSHPHDPRWGKPELLEKYGVVNDINPDATANPVAPPLQSNYLPAHPFHHGHPGLRDEEEVQGVMKSRTEAVVRNEIGREFACIENIDIQIGRVLDKLEAMGELDNTYIFYTADHGMAVGRHGLMGKQNLYEHTWRVPFIVKGPGIRPGSRARGNIYLLDVLPTFCDVAGIQAPETVDGISFRPVLEEKKAVTRDVLYGTYSGGTKPGMRCVRKGKWKLIKYDVLDGTVRETQLFNLKKNPNEFLKEHQDPAVVRLTGHTPKFHQVNLANNPKYAGKRKELERLLLAEQKRLYDPYELQD